MNRPFFDAGRLTNVSGDDNRNITYEYNNKNQLGRVKASQLNSVMLETLYSYDAYGRAAAAQITSMPGSPIQSYSYDSLGRTSAVTSTYAENSQITQNYSYVVNGTNQTGRVESVSYNKTVSGSAQSLLPSLSYGYDAKGNITHVYENGVLKIKYYYDALNRLVREDKTNPQNGMQQKSLHAVFFIFLYCQLEQIMSKKLFKTEKSKKKQKFLCNKYRFLPYICNPKSYGVKN